MLANLTRKSVPPAGRTEINEGAFAPDGRKAKARTDGGPEVVEGAAAVYSSFD